VRVLSANFHTNLRGGISHFARNKVSSAQYLVEFLKTHGVDGCLTEGGEILLSGRSLGDNQFLLVWEPVTEDQEQFASYDRESRVLKMVAFSCDNLLYWMLFLHELGHAYEHLVKGSQRNSLYDMVEEEVRLHKMVFTMLDLSMEGYVKELLRKLFVRASESDEILNMLRESEGMECLYTIIEAIKVQIVSCLPESSGETEQQFRDCFFRLCIGFEMIKYFFSEPSCSKEEIREALATFYLDFRGYEEIQGELPIQPD